MLRPHPHTASTPAMVAVIMFASVPAEHCLEAKLRQFRFARRGKWADATDLYRNRRKVGKPTQGKRGHRDRLGRDGPVADVAGQLQIGDEFIRHDLDTYQGTELRGIDPGHAD